MDILKSKENSAIQAHINMLQGVINRMANNSANCKTWAITIISAILVLYADYKIGKQDIWICYIPMCLFFFLDCYYLGLERQIIKKQSSFVAKINNGTNLADEIFMVKPNSTGNFCKKVEVSTKKLFLQISNTIGAVFSFSTLPFYGSIIYFIYYLGR